MANGTRDSIRPGGAATPFDAASPPAGDATRSASPSRVAQAGNGKSTPRGGTGISGWGDEHGAGFGDGGALPLPGCEQEPVFGPRGLGGVAAAHDPDGGVGDDPPFDLARGLLRPDKDDPERAAAFGDVEQNVLDRA